MASVNLPDSTYGDDLRSLITAIFDPAFYQQRYPDVVAAGAEPLGHFLRWGLGEWRDPNAWFASAWYAGHYPDVASGAFPPLAHYLLHGAREGRNPHPRFDAAWYIEQHPQASGNPLLYHIQTGAALGYITEKPVDIRDYLPSAAKAPRLPRGVRVDVVIPVYRGLKETRRCLDSVLRDAGAPLGRVIVVEDCSPEPDLVTWLRDLAKQARIHLIRNRRNLGFVHSANAGMKAAAPNDVVLLNSDTEVPPGWLARLTAQAYAAPDIATVSPLSNNATICSYPHNDGGPIPLGQTVAEMDEICRTVNAGRSVDVPTTVGFCMYIRRAALAQTGLFDAKRFKFGYGEENDFCLRASALGWRHRLQCDTFVYHKGSVSFGAKALGLSEKASKLLSERFPAYARIVADHVGKGDVNPYRFAITAGLFHATRRPVILMFAHGLGGGVIRHINGLVERFKAKANFLLLRATERGAELSVPSLPGHPVATLPAERMDDLIQLLRSLGVTRVHVHHLMGMDINPRTVIHRLGVPFDVTVHDYLAICPQMNLLPWRHAIYCGEPDIAGCNACIAHRSTHHARDIVTWRMEQAWQFQEAERVFCPSHDVVQRLARYGLAGNAVLAPHETVAAEPWPLRRFKRSTKEKLRIAVLGTLVDHKGGRTVANVAELLNPATTELHLIGHVDGPFPAPALARMTISGRYDEAELPGRIEAIAPHVIWFPVAWPETYSYTLSAAIEAGTAIVAPSLGAFPERLAGRPLTWLLDPATPPSHYLSIFEDARLSLRKKPSSVATRPVVEDYYGGHYLDDPPRRRNLARRIKIAVVPERFENGYPTPCAYIRLLQPLSHPAIAQDFDVTLADEQTILEHRPDIIVTQRFALPNPDAAERLAEHARNSGATLIYDLDDDLLNIPHTHPDAKQLRPKSKTVRRILELADVVWVSTPALADRLAAVRPGTVVIENRLDERIWAYAPPSPPARQTPVRILAMGTATHDGDFAMIEPALLRLKAEYKDLVSIDVLGMTNYELPPGLNRIGPSLHGSKSYPGFVQWLTTQRPSWHIGLAPLMDTPFNRCKSSIKAMDYAAMGMCVLASDVAVYRDSLADGPAGHLVRNTPQDWYSAVDRLLRDADRRQALAASARQTFLAHASLGGDATFRHDAWLRAWRAGKAAPAGISAA